jgi:hypothetical protein
MQTIPEAVPEDFNTGVYGPSDVGFYILSGYVSADWSWSINYGTATANDVQLQSTFAPNTTYTATGQGAAIDVGQLIIAGDTPGQTDAEEGPLTFNLVVNIVEHAADGTSQDFSFTDAYTILDTDFAKFPFAGDATSQTEAIYIGYYGRGGDPDGTNYWTNQLLNGGSMTGIAASFSVQAESRAQYPFLANPLGATTSGAGNDLDQFINSVYQNLFGRAADGTDTSGGLGYWRGQILNVLATHDSTALANELGIFILQVAYGALNTPAGQDQTVLANKVTVADFLTQTFAAHNIHYGSAADQFAHTDIASVTADAASVTTAEAAIIGIVNSLI